MAAVSGVLPQVPEPRAAVFRTFSKPRPAHARRVSSDPVFWMHSLPGGWGGGGASTRREAAVKAFSVGIRINSAELRWGKVTHRVAPGGVAEPRVS